MSDSAHWIYDSGFGSSPLECVPQETVLATMVHGTDAEKKQYFLVPGRVWMDYVAAMMRLNDLRAEIRTYGNPELIVVAQRKGASTTTKTTTRDSEAISDGA